MRIDNRKILIAILTITLLLFPIVALTSGVVRIILGLLFILFLPGYTLLSAIFPGRGSLGGDEPAFPFISPSIEALVSRQRP